MTNKQKNVVPQTTTSGGSMFDELKRLIKELATGSSEISQHFGEANMPTSDVGTCIFSGVIGRSATVVDWVKHLSKLEPSRRFCHPVALMRAVKDDKNLLRDGPVFTIWADKNKLLWYIYAVSRFDKTYVYLFHEDQLSSWDANFRAGSTYS